MKLLRTISPQQLRLREHQVFLALTIVVGILAGLSAVLFTVAIDRVTRVLFGLDPSASRMFLVPIVVSVVTGILLVKVFPGVRGSGIPQTEAAYHLHGGIIPGRVPFGKFLTGVLSIGSGHSMGREGPSVQIGAGLASAVGQWLGLSPARQRDLLAVGAAGALAAAFNTPVAAVLFALEEIIGDLNAGLLGSTVVASVAAVIVERSILGNEPLFRVPTYHLQHPAELLAYCALGIVGGILSVIFCKTLLGARKTFLRMPGWSRMLQPALGGLGIGALLLVAPQVRGVGYEYVDQALNGGMAVRMMVLLCALKIVATIVSYSSGNAGGIFAPSLYIGAMAGGALGTIVHRMAPFPTADPGAYALVGMGTLFAGIVRAPMTSVFMIFEITQDYQILVPLMVANLLAFTISRHYQPTPVYHALLKQDDIHLPTAHSRALPATWTAADVMTAAPPLAPGDATVASLWRQAPNRSAIGWLIGTDDRLEGAVATARLADAVASGEGDAPVRSLLDGDLVHAHPDHPSDIVLERLAAGSGMLPILSREGGARAVGIVTTGGVVRFLGGPRPGGRAHGH